MFGFLKKKEPVQLNETLYAITTGKLIPISEVNDPVFSQKMMGDGFAVIPESGEIYAPIAGEILSVFQTKHAIGMKMANGLEILLHMGIDTVELNGEPFDIKVSEGAKVSQGTLVANVDLEAIKSAGKATDMVVVITNMDAVKSFDLSRIGQVNTGDEVGTAKA
ncbi:PTS system, glucose subfamily, IIA component [Enterococcus haemoperoxidus ATCC BAA-382]|uniref:PTS system IIA component n=1 Tax=Enterococcus haemoperoxidus ATCC BAA-382 TaxID=1158608 RepID=R2QTD8_9ENTE|nr:PTS glucose transporter subunit IIA [Enterococcus haemoperoxidus]EOH99807.1 PTS system, glucose subfamily, IIA component [Enterococcus haemoperoxidus ATCC BAA-382]EOT62451.1 PTS system IIA component [Enterococcus haemoperoxidus ATCC BAA-382]OJG54307.1 PTS system, glucose subfamily, IIA component [Enterococcus haemoperoxidus]